MKKTPFIFVLTFFLFFEQHIGLPPDTAVLYPGKTADEVNARTDSLVTEFYHENSLQVDALFNKFIPRRHPGAAVAIIQDGHILHQNGYGVSDLRTRNKIDSRTCFLLASVTKQFTAMTIMMLVEEGKLSYEDTLPEFFQNIPRSWNKITVKHLLTHTSGLPDRFWLIGYAEGYLNRDIFDRLVKHRQLDFTPGRRFKYSNSGYNVLAMIVEKVSGKRFGDFLQERIFDPLEMNNTVLYDETEPEIPNRAIAYRPTRRGYYRSNDFLLYTSGASGIFSCVEDMFKWDQALYEERLVSKETLYGAFTAQVKAYRREFYGYGWWLTKENESGAVYHTGTLGGISNIFFRIPDKQFSVIILSNRSLKSRRWLVKEITEMYHPGLIDEKGF